MSKVFEREISVGCVKSIKFLRRVNESNLDIALFENRFNAWIVKESLNFLALKGKRPTKNILFDKLGKTRFEKRKKILYAKRIEKLFRRKFTVDSSYGLEKFDSYGRQQSFLKDMQEAVQELEDDPDNALDNIQRIESSFLAKRLSRSDSKICESQDWLENFDDRQHHRKLAKLYPEKYLCIPTGIKALDRVIKGMRAGYLGTITGRTGQGKSIMAMNFAVSAIIQGYDTALFVGENLLEQTMTRIDSRVFHIPYDNFQSFEFNRKKIKAIRADYDFLKHNLESKLEVIKFTPDKFGVPDMYNKLMSLKASKGFEPKLIVVDSYDHFKASMILKEKRLQAASIYWEAKALLMELGVGGWTTTHVKASADDDKPKSEDVAEAIDKARIVDILIRIVRTLEQKLNDTCALAIPKNRDGVDNIQPIPLTTVFAKMIFKE